MLNEFVAYGAQGVPVGSGLISIVPMIIIWGALIYFMGVRPNKKKQKAHKELMDSLKAGDTVITAGGIKGEIVSTNEEFIELRVDKGVKLTFKRASISSVYKKK